jgi:transposase
VIIRVVYALLGRGMRSSYVELCEGTTVIGMSRYRGYLNYRICDSHESHMDRVVFATLWDDEETIQTYIEQSAPASARVSGWKDVAALPWDTGLIRTATVSYIDAFDFVGLIKMWRDAAAYVLRREVNETTLELSDQQWDSIAHIILPLSEDPLVDAKRKPGRPLCEPRLAVQSVLSKIVSGSKWQKVPGGVSGSTGWRRFTGWEEAGTWPQIWTALVPILDTQTRETMVFNFLDCAHAPVKRAKSGASPAPAPSAKGPY